MRKRKHSTVCTVASLCLHRCLRFRSRRLKMKDKDAGLELDYWKDYRIIEAYQYIAYESERKKVIREIEACRTAEEAKAVIDKVRAA